MGLGDDLMATAHARRVYRLDPTRKVAIGNEERRFYWSEVFWHNPIIASPAEIRSKRPVQWIVNASGCRPYIDYAATGCPARTASRFVWKDIGPLEPGEIHFTAAEREPFAEGRFVVVEPHVTRANKDWTFARFQAVVDALPDLRFVQPDYGKQRLRGVESIITRTLRDACRLIRDAAAYIGPEGALHHAAAAVNTPAVVIFGGFISPRQTGYEGQVSLFAGGAPCGSRQPCTHCTEAMAAITPESVADALRSILSIKDQT
jgi:hypothetical protein